MELPETILSIIISVKILEDDHFMKINISLVIKGVYSYTV